MSIDICMITSGRRPELLHQSLDSMIRNTAHGLSYNLTVVFDGSGPLPSIPINHLIIHDRSYGASYSRNQGANSIPRNRRHRHIMFCDDDLYFCPGWDARMLTLAREMPRHIVSGHAHPYNGSDPIYATIATPLVFRSEPVCMIPLVISTPHFMMPWEIWDDVGFFTEPGGPGGSEDFDYSMRAKAKGYGFAVTDPQCVIHTGLTSSSGKPIVGADQVRENNAKLEVIHGIKGKVIYV